MKCVVLVAKRMDSVPIAECGGITLPAGARLIVKEEIADQMLAQYRGLLIWAETIQRPVLRYGHYETETRASASIKVEPIMNEPKSEPIPTGVSDLSQPCEELKEISSDRSMAGVGKKKVKRK